MQLQKTGNKKQVFETYQVKLNVEGKHPARKKHPSIQNVRFRGQYIFWHKKCEKKWTKFSGKVSGASLLPFNGSHQIIDKNNSIHYISMKSDNG